MSHTKLAVVCFVALAACVDGGRRVENPPNKVPIRAVSNWVGEGLSGEFSSPPYPVSVSAKGDVVSPTAVVKGWRSANNPNGFREPSEGFVEIKSANGFTVGAYSDFFQNDPTDPQKKRWIQNAPYNAGSAAGNNGPDNAFVDVLHSNPSVPVSKGDAVLPWKLASQASAINGVSATEINTQVWVQAVAAGLPSPVTYSWTVDGTPLYGFGGTFHDTTYTTPGTREYYVVMTGANSQQVTRDWLVTVTCVGGGLFC